MTEQTAQTEETEKSGSYTCKGRARRDATADDGGKSLLVIFRRPFDTFDRTRRSPSGLRLEVEEEFKVAQRMARRSR